MPTATPATKTAIIFAGEYFDGSAPDHPTIVDLDGKTFHVRVRAMPARHLHRVVALLQDEPALIELVCSAGVPTPDGKGIEWTPVSEEWVDNLTDASHRLLLEAAQRLNFSRAAIWGERQVAAAEMRTKLMMKTDEMLSPVVEKMAHLLISSLKLSASPGTPSTPS